MRTRTPTSTCSARAPWRQTRRRLVPFIGRADTLHTCRDEDGAHWWSDGNAHVDARYLAYARDRFAGCTFWRIDEACIAVRDQRDQALVGILQIRPLPNRPKPKSKRGAA